MRAGDVATGVKHILTYLSMAGKKIPTTPAERTLQGRKALAQMVKHGPWVLFSTANFDPLGNPMFAMLVVGPGEGGLVREPVGGTERNPIVRLTDERPATIAVMRLHRHFARDPQALYEFNRVLEDMFDEVLLGTPSALDYQDGIAVSSHIPFVFGLHRSMTNLGQARGQIHGHGGYCPLVPGLTLEEIQTAGDGYAEEWMRAVMHFVQRTQFTCCQHSARAVGVPEEETEQYRMAMNEQDEKDTYWHRNFLAEVHHQVTNDGAINAEVGKARQAHEDEQLVQDKKDAGVSSDATVCGACDAVFETELCPTCFPDPDDIVEAAEENTDVVSRFVPQKKPEKEQPKEDTEAGK
eukprot:gene28576-54547_t